MSFLNQFQRGLIFGFLALLSLNSCQENKVAERSNVKIFDEYTELFDLAEQSDSEGLSNKLNDMQIGDHFYLKKFNEIQAQRQVIDQCNKLIDQKEFTKARERLEKHIAKEGSTPSMNKALITLRTIQNLDTYREFEDQLSPQDSETKLTIMRHKFNAIFADIENEKLQRHSMNQWFAQELQRIKKRAISEIDLIREISFFQLDSLNIAMHQPAMRGAGIYYRHLNRLSPDLTQHEQQVGDNLINFTSSQSSSPSSLTERIVNISRDAKKHTMAETLSALSSMNQKTQIHSQLRQQVLKKALLTKGWNQYSLTSRPLLDLPTLLEIIEKSEQ